MAAALSEEASGVASEGVTVRVLEVEPGLVSAPERVRAKALTSKA